MTLNTLFSVAIRRQSKWACAETLPHAIIVTSIQTSFQQPHEDLAWRRWRGVCFCCWEEARADLCWVEALAHASLVHSPVNTLTGGGVGRCPSISPTLAWIRNKRGRQGTLSVWSLEFLRKNIVRGTMDPGIKFII